MVAIGEHDHGDGPVCPSCRFKAALAEYLDAAAEDGVEEWHDDTHALTDAMHSALWAMQRLQAEVHGGKSSLIADAHEAGQSLGRLHDVLHDLWHRLLDNDLSDDDPGTGL